MPPRKKKSIRSEAYLEVSAQAEEEILEAYSIILGEEEQDFYLHQLIELYDYLKIPSCFTADFKRCIDYYYEFIRPNTELEFDATNVKHYTTLNFIHAFTITGKINKLNMIIDIIDIDKLIRNSNRLLKFRDNFNHIYQSWEMFVTASTISGSSSEINEQFILNYKLGMKELKKIKTDLQLDTDRKTAAVLGDSFLIDMLSLPTTNERGEILNFDFNKPKIGLCVTIKDFAEILGNLGELESTD
ncbi:Rad33-domain-containing protein [Scheffersomyces coipomensis]|uniref:Rad33-domain-containing protein n=1 Tax=Scheffersomyces coipomensis TaxID=1788519 RepID=UPI00315DEA28